MTNRSSAESPSWLSGKDGKSRISKEMDDKFNYFFERCNYIQTIISDVLVSKRYLQKTRDIQIQVGDTMFNTHRFLLLHHAENLGRKTFESEDKFIPLVGVTSSCFRVVYHWMYGLKVTLGVEDQASLNSTVTVQDLIKAAKQLGFNGGY